MTEGQSERAETLEFREDRRLLLGLLVVFAPLAWFISTRLLDGGSLVIMSIPFPAWVLAAFLIPFVWGLNVATLIRLLRQTPAYVLDEDGLTLARPRARIQWRDISGMSGGEKGVLTLHLKDPEKFLESLRPIDRWLRRINHWRTPVTLKLGTHLLEAERGEVAAATNAG